MRLGVLSDLHLVVDPRSARGAWHNAYDFDGLEQRLALAAEHLDRQNVDAVALVGDLTHLGRDTSLAVLDSTVLALGVPVLAVTGNHDAAGPEGLAAALHGRAALASAKGQEIDGVVVAGMHVAAGPWFGARLTDAIDIDSWNSGPVVLLSHYPLLSHAVTLSECGMPYPGDVIDRALHADALVARAQPTVVVSGHVHARVARAYGPVLQLTQGALVEPPYEISVIDIERDADVLRVRRVSVLLPGRSAENPVPVFTGVTLAASFAGGTWAIEDAA